MKTRKKPFKLRYFISPVIVLGGFLIMVALIAGRKKPSREVRTTYSGALVKVMQVEETTRQVDVTGYGTVSPRREIKLVPQVGGRVDWVNPDFVSGGIFQEGDTLLRIEPIDYELAVQQAEAAVARSEYALAMAQANADIARHEWGKVHPQSDTLLSEGEDSLPQPDALVLHQPQLKQAWANLASAEAALDRTQLNLSRTVLTAPFDLRVKQESVDKGQYVVVGAPLATLYSTDMIEIEVGLPLDDLSWIKVPGSEAEVIMELKDGDRIWHGRVNRNVGVIDQRERLARIVVRVLQPFQRRRASEPELSLGTFVKVVIHGRPARNVIAVPRSVIHENSTVWTVAADTTLDIHPVTIKRYTEEEALISSGLKPGDLVVLTPLTGAANGLKLQPVLVENAGDVE